MVELWIWSKKDDLEVNEVLVDTKINDIDLVTFLQYHQEERLKKAHYKLYPLNILCYEMHQFDFLRIVKKYLVAFSWEENFYLPHF